MREAWAQTKTGTFYRTNALEELNFIQALQLFQFTQQKVLDISLIYALHESTKSGEKQNWMDTNFAYIFGLFCLFWLMCEITRIL